jgi:hypothetical protein
MPLSDKVASSCPDITWHSFFPRKKGRSRFVSHPRQAHGKPTSKLRRATIYNSNEPHVLPLTAATPIPRIGEPKADKCAARRCAA